MSVFTPTNVSLHPADRPDQLSSAVMQSLSRPLDRHGPWGPLRTLVLGGVTWGIYPLLVWPRRFNQFLVAEQQQLWHLVEWLRTNDGSADAASVQDAIGRNNPEPLLWIAPMACGLLVAGVFCLSLLQGRIDWDQLYNATYGFGHLRYDIMFPRSSPWSNFYLHRSLHSFWFWCMFIGYGAHWMHVKQHAARTTSILKQINALLTRQGIAPVKVKSLRMGMRPIWMIAAVFACCYGVWWSIAAAAAGAAHERYVRRVSLTLRGELAQRVRQALLQYRPPLDVPVPYRFRRNCANPQCAQRLPDDAAFCVRCGAPAPPRPART